MGARRRRRSNVQAGTGRLLSWANVGIVLLALLTIYLVALAMRNQEPPTADASAVAATSQPTASTSAAASALPRVGSASRPATPSPVVAPAESAQSSVLLAGVDEALWRWVGPTACTPGAVSGVLSRSTDNETWAAVTAPGDVVSWVEAASTDVATATVFDAACAPSVVTTSDGGSSWESLDASGALSQVSLGRPDGRWALREGAVVREVNEVFAAPGAEPCVGTDVSSPSMISALSTSVAYVVCQATDGSGRLLTRTRDGGASWTRLAGKRADTGLAGTGVIASLHMANATRGAVLIRSAACAAGQVRVTFSGGLRWTALPCVEVGNSDVTTVHDVVVRADGSLVAAALTAAGPRMLTSLDGSNWTESGEL